MKKIYNLSIYLLLLFVLHSCTTYKSQYGKNIVNPIEEKPTNSELTHRFYLIGDAGNAEEPEAQETLKLFEERLKESDENATLVFLGDNIYPKGMPTEKGSKERKLAEEKITFQLEIAKNFKGKTVFIAGNHDWYNGIEGLEAQSKFVTDYLEDKKAFLPVLFLMATLITNDSILPKAHNMDIYLTSVSIIITLIYIIGMVLKLPSRKKGLGIDSWVVLIVYLFSIVGMIAIQK